MLVLVCPIVHFSIAKCIRRGVSFSRFPLFSWEIACLSRLSCLGCHPCLLVWVCGLMGFSFLGERRGRGRDGTACGYVVGGWRHRRNTKKDFTPFFEKEETCTISYHRQVKKVFVYFTYWIVLQCLCVLGKALLETAGEEEGEKIEEKEERRMSCRLFSPLQCQVPTTTRE